MNCPRERERERERERYRERESGRIERGSQIDMNTLTEYK